MKVVVNVDGGSRGNPGPAGIAAVATDPSGEVLAERSETIGEATNNVAEYRALLLGIELAKELGADEVELVGDSKLIVEQVRGNWKVKQAHLRPLHTRSRDALAGSAELVDPARQARRERARRPAAKRCSGLRGMTITDENAGTIEIGERKVRRLGFGAMRITGPGIWGPPADHDERHRGPPPCGGARRQPDRHGRLVWAERQRGADRRGPPPVSGGPADRHQGRADSHGPRTSGPPMGARSTCARRARARCGACSSSRSSSTSSTAPTPRFPTRTRSERSRSSRTRARSATSASPTSRSTSSRPPARSSRSSRSRTASTSPTATRRTCSSAARSLASPSSPGRRSRPATSPSPAARSTGSPRSTTRRRARWRSPGSWRARRSILPIPGTSSVEHLEENLAAVALQLSDDEVAELECGVGLSKEKAGPLRSPAFPPRSGLAIYSPMPLVTAPTMLALNGSVPGTRLTPEKPAAFACM